MSSKDLSRFEAECFQEIKLLEEETQSGIEVLLATFAAAEKKLNLQNKIELEANYSVL